MNNDCITNKFQYQTKSKAMSVVKSMNRANRLKRKSKQQNLSEYKCGECGWFHVGCSVRMRNK